jgi:hypothetical protein
LQNTVLSQQDISVRILGRLVLLQNTLREQPGMTLLLQIIRVLLPVNDDEPSAKGFVMQNKGSESSARLAGSSEQSAGVLARTNEVPAREIVMLDRVFALPDKGREVPERGVAFPARSSG